jgi:hypothetical protein
VGSKPALRISTHIIQVGHFSELSWKSQPCCRTSGQLPQAVTLQWGLKASCGLALLSVTPVVPCFLAWAPPLSSVMETWPWKGEEILVDIWES